MNHAHRLIIRKALSNAVTVALAMVPMCAVALPSSAVEAIESKRTQCPAGDRWATNRCVAEATKADTDSLSIGPRYAAGGGNDGDGGNNVLRVALGSTVAVNADKSVGIGSSLTVNAANAIALGSDTVIGGIPTVAVDATSTGAFVVNGHAAQSANSVALLGNATYAPGGVVVGSSSSVTGGNSIAIGEHATVWGGNKESSSVAIGSGASVVGAGAVALGSNSTNSNRYNVVSVGNDTLKRQIINVAAGKADTDAVNLGQMNAALDDIDVGDTAYFKANGLNDGTDDAAATGASSVAAGPSAKATGPYASAYGAQAIAATSGSIAIGSFSVADGGPDAIALGNGAHAYGGGGQIAIGLGALTSSYNTIALGTQAQSHGHFATAVGYQSFASAAGDVALGANAHASGVNGTKGSAATALGQNAYASGWGATAMGEGASANAGYSTTIGAASSVQAGGGVAIGHQAQVLAAADNAVALGINSIADRANSVSVGSAGHERQITNVAAGTQDTDAVNLAQLKATGLVDDGGQLLDAVAYDAGAARGRITFGGLGGTLLTNVMAGSVTPGSTDAVNGSQLWALQDQVDRLDGRVGNIENGNLPPVNPVNPVNPGNAGAHFASSGDQANPAVASGASSVAVGEGAQATGSNSSAIGPGSVASANNSTAVGSGAQATADNSVALGSGSVADRANSVSVGSEGQERQITNVAAGTADTDAVNVAQLNETKDWARDYTDEKVSALDRRVSSLGRRADAGTAAAMAMANLPQAYAPNQSSVGAGVGTFNGQSAMSMGMSTISESGRWVFRASASANTQGDKGAGFGAAMVW
jgi:autotransporter adhesin